MAMKQQQKKVYKSMQGKTVDMDMLRQRNELTPAVGNARVNARGDELGSGGKIVKKREDVMKDYYDNASGLPEENPVKRSRNTEAAAQQNETVAEESTDDWVEDPETGDFVKKTTRSKRGR